MKTFLNTALVLTSLLLCGAHTRGYCSGAAKTPTKIAPKSGPSLKTLSLMIPVLDCADCAAGVKATLKKVTGVKSFKTDTRTKRVIIAYLPTQVSPQRIADSLAKAGWQSAPVSPKTTRAHGKTAKTDAASMGDEPLCSKCE